MSVSTWWQTQRIVSRQQRVGVAGQGAGAALRRAQPSQAQLSSSQTTSCPTHLDSGRAALLVRQQAVALAVGRCHAYAAVNTIAARRRHRRRRDLLLHLLNLLHLVHLLHLLHLFRGVATGTELGLQVGQVALRCAQSRLKRSDLLLQGGHVAAAAPRVAATVGSKRRLA